MNASGPQARLAGLIGLAALLFSPPLVLIFDRPPAAGLSWLPLYLFVAWLLVIALAAWLMEHRQEEG
ncbi:hypothetical protein HOP62_02230 [Halomonas sp. MCCC 1A17488]|uniref:DUF3311 domain-containing protein n=1 Tax=Billgrantia sulfidoxydans TaxID=2733484 RepID=A0ABX7W6E9_9GAMM|nr:MULTISPECIES: hypothetical protein [Halomonas]MCE8014891.1 hypothetical protein [Halomonas sp. MCCC 1A17488]MCG3238224.1 hypothetical protein [Halomonas sp. MCCC 1A17488]QPP48012.1 hypothetical protein I4484_12170 [Halomonas sp. SS10-MC5]QTP55320.1 hypothetical protein HNO51_11885 [Halomonas sulfidoxydans]